MGGEIKVITIGRAAICPNCRAEFVIGGVLPDGKKTRKDAKYCCEDCRYRAAYVRRRKAMCSQ